MPLSRALLRRIAAMTPVALAFLLAGCTGAQSALAPAGRDASRIADLFWGMIIGAAVIWVLVIGLTLYATYASQRTLGTRGGRRLIIGGGVVFPTVVLAGLLTYGLAMLPAFSAPAPAQGMTIEVTGLQWWWRVRYTRDDGSSIELANEIHLPVGEPVVLELGSADVIHSLWVPALAGKMDMIPGRTTRLRIEPTKTGTYRGICAEYCGASHALMAFFVVVEERAEFDRWLARQAEPAKAAAEPLAAQGADRFLANGCGACHTVRGTAAGGGVGPDLTHVGGRVSLGAGILTTEAAAFRRWISRTGEVKPSVHMPAFGMLPAEDLDALAVYLDGLK